MSYKLRKWSVIIEIEIELGGINILKRGGFVGSTQCG